MSQDVEQEFLSFDSFFIIYGFLNKQETQLFLSYCAELIVFFHFYHVVFFVNDQSMMFYRQEIDGLRLIFYHAGFMLLFSGGYVGVDIFFGH